ncbi:MAG: hypothetical protein H6719_30395 [Sandaracinaceae bacterium]|nr:hypothetical protein [Sandaracinaceae bacterium]
MTRVALLGVLLAGCGDAAILELTLELPAASARCDSAIARVDARFLAADETACPVATGEWRGDALDVAVGDTPSTLIVDVVADDDEVELPLCLRLRPCDGPGCPRHDPLVDPSLVAELARPFHRGQRTRWTLTVRDLCFPDDRGVIDACAIGGCTDEIRASYCRDDGSHLCD